MSYARTDVADPDEAGGEGDPETTRDGFLDGRLTVLQPKAGPRAAIDPLFLAAAVPAREGERERALEAGVGAGVASLTLAARVSDADVTGVDMQSALLRLAEENARANGFGERVTLVRADITASGAALERAGLARAHFHHVFANPPFHTSGQGRRPANRAREQAHMAEADALEGWIRSLTGLAAARGTLTLIHQPGVLGTLLGLLEGRFGGIVIFPLFPHTGERAIRVLVQGVKGSRAPASLAPGLVLQDDGGAYTPEADAVLREAEPLDLGRFRM